MRVQYYYTRAIHVHVLLVRVCSVPRGATDSVHNIMLVTNKEKGERLTCAGLDIASHATVRKVGGNIYPAATAAAAAAATTGTPRANPILVVVGFETTDEAI